MPTPQVSASRTSPLENVFQPSTAAQKKPARLFAEHYRKQEGSTSRLQTPSLDNSAREGSRSPLNTTSDETNYARNSKGKGKELPFQSEWFSSALAGSVPLHEMLKAPQSSFYPHMPTMKPHSTSMAPGPFGRDATLNTEVPNQSHHPERSEYGSPMPNIVRNIL